MSTKAHVLAVEAKLFMADIVPLLKRSGFTVATISPADLDIAWFDAHCREHAPAFVFSVNFSPEVAFLCSRARVLYVSWTVDPLPASRWKLLRDTDPSWCLAFCHRAALVPDIRALGIRCEHLPLAASERRQRDPQAKQTFPVSFVGNSMAGEERALVVALQHHGPDVVEAVVNWLGTLPVPPPSELPVPDCDEHEMLVDLAAGALSHRSRLRRVQTCLPFGARVWGDGGWSALGEAYRGRADHGEQLTHIYQRSIVNLDIPRLYQRDIVTMRVFDVLACGGVVLCEPSAELSALFDEGRHLLTYRSEAELVERIRTLLMDASLRQFLSDNGHAYVLAKHRLEHRVEVILDHVRCARRSQPGS